MAVAPRAGGAFVVFAMGALAALAGFGGGDHGSGAVVGRGDGLAAAFAELGAAYLDDPPYPDQLTGCVADKNYDCLVVYASKRAAMKRIFDGGREEALRRTVSAVREHCAQGEPRLRWQTCAGAVYSFFFFYKPVEDEAIRKALAQMPESTIRHILIDAEGEQAWCYNRPDAELWVQLIDSWTFLQKYRKDYQDEGWLKHIFERAADHKGEVQPILMYDPEFQIDAKLGARVEEALRRDGRSAARVREKVRRFGGRRVARGVR